MRRPFLDNLRARLDAREHDQSLRRLIVDDDAIDFCSNDYLGLARDPVLQCAIRDAEQSACLPGGSTGSRLISGNSAQAEHLEVRIAEFHRAEAALLFNTGYAANSGLFACLLGAGDTLVLDELVHASIIDGVRLSKAARLIFRHNDLEDLERKLRQATGQVVVGVESLYSMDGDEAPLPAILELTERHGAELVVDEAHSTGVYGPDGRGIVVRDGLESRVLARVCTFGKALGLHGAAVVGARVLQQYLVNFARPFVYSTAPPPALLTAIDTVYGHLPGCDAARAHLFALIGDFRERARASRWQWLDSGSAIQSVVIPGNAEVRRVAAALRAERLRVVPIVAPTVPAGRERIRVCVHAHNTHADVERLFAALEATA